MKQGYNLLQWTSTDEFDNKYFTLEKSKDAISFYPIKIIAPDANNFGIHTYMARDENPEKCINYYRLRQTDGNNTTYISHTIQLNNKGSGAITYAYNAQSNLLWIYCTECTDKKYLLKLTDDLGRIVYTSADNENPLVYHTEQLTRSVYVLHVITAGDESVYKILIY